MTSALIGGIVGLVTYSVCEELRNKRKEKKLLRESSYERSDRDMEARLPRGGDRKSRGRRKNNPVFVENRSESSGSDVSSDGGRSTEWERKRPRQKQKQVPKQCKATPWVEEPKRQEPKRQEPRRQEPIRPWPEPVKPFGRGMQQENKWQDPKRPWIVPVQPFDKGMQQGNRCQKQGQPPLDPTRAMLWAQEMKRQAQMQQLRREWPGPVRPFDARVHGMEKGWQKQKPMGGPFGNNIPRW